MKYEYRKSQLKIGQKVKFVSRKGKYSPDERWFIVGKIYEIIEYYNGNTLEPLVMGESEMNETHKISMGYGTWEILGSNPNSGIVIKI